MIRVVLPIHLRRLAGTGKEVEIQVEIVNCVSLTVWPRARLPFGDTLSSVMLPGMPNTGARPLRPAARDGHWARVQVTVLLNAE